MSWLSSLAKKAHFKIDKHSFGNLLKNVSPVASFIPGLGIPVTAALAAGGEALRGKTKLSDMLRAASSNAAIGGGARTALQGIQGLAGNLGGGGAASASVTGAPVGAVPSGGLPMPSVPDLTRISGGIPGRPLGAMLKAGASNVGRGAKAVGGFADRHAGGLQLAGQVAGGVLNARTQDAQTDFARERFDFEKTQYSEQEQRRKQLAEMLAPLLQPAYRG